MKMFYTAALSLFLVASCSKEQKSNPQVQNQNEDTIIQFSPLNINTILSSNIVTIEPQSMDFSSIEKGIVVSQDLIIKNTQLSPLLISNEEFISNDISPFVISSNTCITSLTRNRTCKITIQLSNPTELNQNVQLNKSFSIKGININLTGEQKVFVANTNPIEGLTVSPISLDFGTLKPSQNKELSLLITNKSLITQNITAPVISNANFTLTNSCGGTLARNRSCTMKIKYTATLDDVQVNQTLSSLLNNPLTYSVNVSSIVEEEILAINPLIISSSNTITEPSIINGTISFKNLGTSALPSPVTAISSDAGIVINSVSCSAGLDRNRVCSVDYSLNAALLPGGISSQTIQLKSGSFLSIDHTISLNITKLGPPPTYEPVFSSYSSCSAALSCSGQGIETRTITSCQKFIAGEAVSGGTISNCSSFSIPANLTRTCSSPSGTVSDVILGGNKISSCVEGSTVKSFVSFSCNEGYLKNTSTIACDEGRIISTSIIGNGLVVGKINSNEVMNCLGPISNCNNLVLKDSNLSIEAIPNGAHYFSAWDEDCLNYLNACPLFTSNDKVLAGSFLPKFNKTFRPLDSNDVKIILIQPDGKFLVIGGFSTVQGVSRKTLVRLHQNGVVDLSFNAGNAVSSGGISTAAILPDGKFLIGGGFYDFNNVSKRGIVRLLSNGVIDPTFTLAADSTSAIEVLPSGKIMIAGGFSTILGQPRSGIARLNADGSLDSTFNPGTGLTGYNIKKILPLSNGKFMIVGGNFTTYNGVTRNKIVRINNDGSLDTTFDPLLGPNNTVNHIAVTSEGKYIIGGLFTTYNGVTQNRLAQLNEDGSLDSSFNIGAGLNNNVNYISILPNNKLLIGGSFTTYKGVANTNLIYLNNDGSIDPSFNIGTGFTNGGNSVSVIIPRTNGKILIAGNFAYYKQIERYGILQLNSDASLDDLFKVSESIQGKIVTAVKQPDGKILIGGNFINVYGIARDHIARLNADGSLDSSFVPFSGIGSNTSIEIRNILLQANGKMIITGSFPYYLGTTNNSVGITRLNSDGSLDQTFTPDPAITSRDILRLGIQPVSGKVILLGSIYNGNTNLGIIRLNENGTTDNTFIPSSNVINLPYMDGLAFEPDGKIIVAGDYYSGSNNIYKVGRMNINGSQDTSFTMGVANGHIKNIERDLNGKYILTGMFSSYEGTTMNKILRLNSNGSLDTTFNAGVSVDNQILSTLIQPDEKIIIAGYFTTHSGQARSGISRLNADGTIDLSFTPGTGISRFGSSAILSMLNDLNNKILIFGDFQTYSDISAGSILKLNTNGTESN